MACIVAQRVLAVGRCHAVSSCRNILRNGLQTACSAQNRRRLSTDSQTHGRKDEATAESKFQPIEDVWLYDSDFDKALGHLTADAAWPFRPSQYYAGREEEAVEQEVREGLLSGFDPKNKLAASVVNRNAAKLIISLRRIQSTAMEEVSYQTKVEEKRFGSLSGVDAKTVLEKEAKARSMTKDALAALQLHVQESIETVPGERDLPKFVSTCSQAVLTSIVQGLRQPLPTLEEDGAIPLTTQEGLIELRRLAVEELLKRGHLERRACLVLLQGLPDVPEELVDGILAAAKEGLGYVKDRIGLITSHEMAHVQHIEALEGLAALQARMKETSGKAEALAADLVDLLRGAPEIVRLLMQQDKVHLGLRVLAALWHFPGIEDSSDGRDISAWLASLSGVRWSKELHPSMTEETMAFAACFLARAGAWRAARGRFLANQALRRHYNALRIDNGEAPLSPDAGALWLLALAQAGEDVDALTRRNAPFKAPLLTSIEPLASMSGSELQIGSETGAARALWALAAMGKLEEPMPDGVMEKLEGPESDGSTFGTALLARLEMEDQVFSYETRALLAELRGTLTPDVEAAEESEPEEAEQSSEVVEGEEKGSLLQRLARLTPAKGPDSVNPSLVKRWQPEPTSSD